MPPVKSAVRQTLSPEMKNYLAESYEKENNLRMKWNVLHEKRLKEAATFLRPEKGDSAADVAAAVMLSGMAATERDHIAAGYNRRRTPRPTGLPGIAHMKKGHSIPEVGLGDPKDDPRLARPHTSTSPDPVMRPVPPEQTRILYDGLPFFGREKYLNLRKGASPEAKYYFQEVTSWGHGWRLKDSYFGRPKGPEYKLEAIVSHGGMSHSGPQHDPDHYKNPSSETPCTL